jgi:ATP-dependent Clp protease, protease subunit
MPSIWAIKARAAKASDELAIDLYDVIGSDMGSEGIASGEVLAVLNAAPNAKKLLVRINSAGGIVTEGLAIYNMLKQSPAAVTCRVDALAGSISSIIAMGGAQLEMAEHSFLMIHNPFGAIEGGSGELRHKADLLDTMREQMVDIYCAKSGLERAAVAKMMDDETWITAQQALELGFADRVIPDARDKIAAHFDLSAFRNTPRAIHRTGALRAEAPTNGAASAPRGELPMTDEEKKKLEDLEAAVSDLTAKLKDAESAKIEADKARVSAEANLAAKESAAVRAAAEEEAEEEEDEEEVAAKAVVQACIALTGEKDLVRLEGAVMALGPKLNGAANALAARSVQVSNLIAKGKLLPAQKNWALKCKPEALAAYLESIGDTKLGPAGEEEHTPNDEAPEVIAARAAAKNRGVAAFDPAKITLTAAEKHACKVMNRLDPAAQEARFLADKVARAKAEFEMRASA